jgi:hypothetical protein
MCPSSGELIVSIRRLVYVILYRWPFSVQVCTWWAHGCPKHVQNRSKHTWKRIVRQVGYLQRLYRDAWSTEHKTYFFLYRNIFRPLGLYVPRNFKHAQYFNIGLLDYWLAFYLCLKCDGLLIDSHSTWVFIVTTWLSIPIRLVFNVTTWLILDCVFKIDLGVVNLQRHIIYKIRPSVVVFLHGTGYMFVTGVSFIWCSCVFNNTVKCYRPRHITANKFKLKTFFAGEYRHRDDGRNLRYMLTFSLQAISNIIKSPQISCNSLFALLCEL